MPPACGCFVFEQKGEIRVNGKQRKKHTKRKKQTKMGRMEIKERNIDSNYLANVVISRLPFCVGSSLQCAAVSFLKEKHKERKSMK